MRYTAKTSHMKLDLGELLHHWTGASVDLGSNLAKEAVEAFLFTFWARRGTNPVNVKSTSEDFFDSFESGGEDHKSID